MKKLLLITGILLSNSLLANPMDKVCSIFIDKADGISDFADLEEYISENCERNNIITFYGHATDDEWNSFPDMEVPRYYQIPFHSFKEAYCRFDRNVLEERDYFITVTCVLYDNKPRTYIEQ